MFSRAKRRSTGSSSGRSTLFRFRLAWKSQSHASGSVCLSAIFLTLLDTASDTITWICTWPALAPCRNLHRVKLLAHCIFQNETPLFGGVFTIPSLELCQKSLFCTGNTWLKTIFTRSYMESLFTAKNRISLWKLQSMTNLFRRQKLQQFYCYVKSTCCGASAMCVTCTDYRGSMFMPNSTPFHSVDLPM